MITAKRDGATVSAPKEAIAWELVKMVCYERERCYVEQESKLRNMVDAYRLTTADQEKNLPDESRPLERDGD